MIQVSWNPDASLSNGALDAGAVVQHVCEPPDASFGSDGRPVASWLYGRLGCIHCRKTDCLDRNIGRSRSTCRRVGK